MRGGPATCLCFRTPKKTPIQTCLILPINKYRCAGSLHLRRPLPRLRADLSFLGGVWSFSPNHCEQHASENLRCTSIMALPTCQTFTVPPAPPETRLPEKPAESPSLGGSKTAPDGSSTAEGCGILFANSSQMSRCVEGYAYLEGLLYLIVVPFAIWLCEALFPIIPST